MKLLALFTFSLLILFLVLVTSGCSNTEAKQPAPQAMPVKTEVISLAAVPRTDEYVATIKSRRSASIQPQVDGSLTKILVKSGDHVRAGQVLMTIDPLKQQATVDQQHSTEAQKKAILDYTKTEVERQRRLFEGGVTSKQNYDYAVQAYENSKADWESAQAARVTQERQLAYYHLTAPFAGIVGDIPVHVGDRADRKHEDQLYFPAGGQWPPGHPGQSSGPQVAGYVPQCAVGESAGGVELCSYTDGPGAGSHAHWRTIVCLCRNSSR